MGKRKMIYTGIGSRETPPHVLDQMRDLGTSLAVMGWTLRSGHAPGADQAFENGVRKAKVSVTQVEIYLPWPKFEGAPNTVVSVNQELKGFITPSVHCPQSYRRAVQVAARFHPAWQRCSEGARKLHTRNVYQVAGQNLATASDFVVCWTVDGKRGGGTGQALRIAEYLKLPIFDLAVCSTKEVLEFVNKRKDNA